MTRLAVLLLLSAPAPAMIAPLQAQEAARGSIAIAPTAAAPGSSLASRICLTVGGRSFTAQCQMSLNVPMWREVSQGCLGAALPAAPATNPASAPTSDATGDPAAKG